METLYAQGDPAELDTAVRGHLRQDPGALHAWLVDAGRLRSTRRWLATSLTAPTWHRLLTLVAPAAAPALQRLLQRRNFGRGWTRLSRQRWSQTSGPVREATLTALLVNPPARMDPATVMAATLEQAAQRFHTTAAQVATVLLACLERATSRRSPRPAECGALHGWLCEQAAGDDPDVAALLQAGHTRDRGAEADGDVAGTDVPASANDAGAAATSIGASPGQATRAAAAPGPAGLAAAGGARPPTDPPPQPARALARALQQQDATSVWLAWQACEATDPAGAGAQLAALCRQPDLRETLARCLPTSRQMALVARVAPGALPLLHAWFGRHGDLERRMAPRDVASRDRAAAWSVWWAAWASADDERTAVADLRSRWRVLDDAAARAGARRLPAGDPDRPAAAEASSLPSPHGVARPTLAPALPALLRQWQATTPPARMAPALRRAWHLACGTAGARAWLVASLPPARLHALAAQLEPGEAPVLRAWTQAPWWPTWRNKAAAGTAAWTLSGWWRLWFARWAAGPPMGAFDRAGALDAWLVHAARASGQRLPDYLEGLVQRLQTTLASPHVRRPPGSAVVDRVAAPTGTSSAAVTASATADPTDFVLQRARALSLAARESGHSGASRRATQHRRSAKTPLATAASRSAASTLREVILSPTPPAHTPASPRRPPPPATDARRQPAAAATRWRPPPAPDLEPGEAVTVNNAGLVLLAGFAPRLFSMLGLLEGRAFMDEDAAARAVHLLQWLVDERWDADEHELVLNKVLCGLPTAAPVPSEVVLQPRELDAARQMLQGVIAHWSAIGRTSVQGLRESFLQREGRLSRDEAAWRLRVAPRAFDMLLDRLPWSYTMLKLPWMPEVLHVEWR